ncbi:MAG: hypothetical protein HY597_05200 [Candidatus Omnitrophica bacterium]|nr:hypothetical protein [Candidatus Omnitrophota bacterium]
MDYLPRDPLNRAVLALPRVERRAIAQRLTEESRRHGLVFNDDRGRPKVIDVMLRPWVVTPQQIRYYRYLSLQIRDALSRLWRLYFYERPEVQAVLPFGPEEESWVAEANRLTTNHTYMIVGRLDSNAVYHVPHWREEILFLEPNAVGVGGVHYGPAAQEVVRTLVGPALQRTLPRGLRLTTSPDPRLLLMREAQRLTSIRGRAMHIALIENEDYKSGTDEFQSLARYLNAHDFKAVVTDPRHLRLRRGGVYLRDLRIDVVYRDCELKEFIEIEAKGHRLDAMRHAVSHHMLLSSATGEFDHKSAWEIFTEPRYAKHFTAAQRAIFRKHFLWTRLFREARVNGPDGREVDLIVYTRRHRAHLVLKPNHSYGGTGVVVGFTASQASWERTMHRALRGPERYVVQRLAPVCLDEFPVLDDDGRAALVRRRVISGFFVTSGGIGFVGRFSRDAVVNVSRGGGLIPVLAVR